jgi:hypothetical protein
MIENSHLLELYKQHCEGKDKYTYFLLTVAGAAIGFAVQKTDGAIISWWLLPVAAATISWTLSFYFGCKNLDSVLSAILVNYNLLQLKQGSHSNQPNHPQAVQIAMQSTMAALDSRIDEAAKFARRQFWFLISGVALFVLWRVLEMIRLTYGI